MPRLMSVSMTTQAVIERRKTVTRRRGWTFLRPGDRLTLCRKVQGRKPGEPLERLAEVEVVSVRRESLWHLVTGINPQIVDGAWVRDYVADEMVREGFPGLDPDEFVRRYFINGQGMAYDDRVTRIEWRYLEGGQ